tara:strand:+ start:224 stop:1612 length:1389 start_codon:yes stop_codon:yes gene_type:complete
LELIAKEAPLINNELSGGEAVMMVASLREKVADLEGLVFAETNAKQAALEHVAALEAELATPTPEYVWARLLDNMVTDNGGPYMSSTADFDEARPAIAALIEAGFFLGDPNDLDSDYWQAVGGEVDEAKERFASHAEQYLALDSVLHRVFESPADFPAPVEPFQQRVHSWMLECFGPAIAADRAERNHRFLEEALELVQSVGCTADEAHRLVDYVYGRPTGEPVQEAGGVMVTLAALCAASELDMAEAGEQELARISQPDTLLRIREKQRNKPSMSPLPGVYPERAAPVERVEQYGYQATFNAIAAATKVHGSNAVAISVEAFRKSLAQATPQPAPTAAQFDARDLAEVAVIKAIARIKAASRSMPSSFAGGYESTTSILDMFVSEIRNGEWAQLGGDAVVNQQLTTAAQDVAGMVEALEWCEKWFSRHSPTAALVSGEHATHPMLSSIRAALAAHQSGGAK